MLKIILLLTAAAIIAVLAGCSTETGPDAGADAGPVADAGDTFPPDRQTPLFEKGLVIPRNFLPCKAEDGSETYNCNHHGSTIAMLRDGTMAITWYHGLGEKSRDTRILWSRLYPGAKEWSPAEVLFDDPLRAEGNPAIWVDEKGVVWVFFVVIYGRDAWDDAEIMYVKSPDNGASWTAPVTLREEFGWMTRQRPLRLANGGILLPCYNERLALPTFIRSMDNFATWEEMPSDSAEYVVNHVGNIQPSIILRNDGSVLALTRNGMPDRRVGSMSSVSNGRSWTPNVFTALPNSGTSIDQFKLRDGHVVVIFNND
ncbi:MAG: exo-alpha-sialidase [Myxococcota bacterium]|jgi:predicted neuraminidase